MSTSTGRRYLSVAIVLCMVLASIAVLFSAMTVRGMDYQTPVTHFDGNETMQMLGRSVVLMDLNGDHIGDLVVGAPYTSSYGLANAGSVTVYLSTGGVIVINGTHSGDLFGFCVANVSDVNDDGMADLAVGAPLAEPAGLVGAGNVTVFYGWDDFNGAMPNLTINSAVAGEELGYSIAAAGDVNGDGIDDMIVGAPYYDSGSMTGAGNVYIYDGGTTMDSAPDKTFTGSVGGAHLGFSVAGGVNVDQDATLDMVAGAPDQGTAGAVYIIRNLDRTNPTVNVVNGKAAGDKFGHSVAMLQDMDGNAFGEIAVGAPYNDDKGPNAGEVSLIYGSSRFNTVIDLNLMGSPGEWFGWALAGGDFHQDTLSDLLVGAPNSRLNASSIGRAYAYFGAAALSSSPNITLVPDSGTSFFGGSLAVGDNATGDHAPDFAVGDPLFNVPGHSNAGRVYLYSGFSLPTPPSLPRVQGHVYIPGTTIGLAGFTVSLESPLFKMSATTDATGGYEMDAVPGTYWLNASMTAYVTNSTYPFTLAMDDVKTKDFYPLTVPVVKGTVRDVVSAKVIPGASVALYNGTNLVTTVTTPVNGTYRILLPTQYVPAEGAATDLTLKVWHSTHYMNITDFSVVRNETKLADANLDRFPVVGGSVRDALDLSAVRGTIVANQGSTIVATTTTSIRGIYAFEAVNASSSAELWVNVTATGYFRTNDSLMVVKNQNYTLNFILAQDNVKPTSQVSSLPQYETTDTFKVSATASDPNGNGIKEVQLWYKRAEAPSYALYATDSTSPYDFNFDSATTGGNGVYEFYSIATDWADNVEDAASANDTWTNVDSHAPTLAITAPTEGQQLASSTVAVSWTGSDAGSGIAKYEVQLDASGWVDKALATSHSFTSVSGGSHLISVRATDNVGLATTKTVNVTLDLQSPTLVITAPTEGQLSANPTIAVAWTGSDAGSGIAKYEVQLDASGWVDKALATAHDFTSVPDGSHTISVRATDNGGLTTTKTVNVIVDTTSPVSSLGALPTYTATATFELNATATDANGIELVQFYYRFNGSGSFSYLGNDASSPYTFQVDTSSLNGNGKYEFYSLAVDNAGNNESAPAGNDTWTLVDTAPPTLTITFPQTNQEIKKSNLTVHWVVKDDISGVAQVSISVDGGAFHALGVVDLYQIEKLDDGKHNITIRVTDKAGNTMESTVEFTISTEAGTSTVLIGAIAVVVIVIVIVAALMLMRRKKTPPPPEEKDQGKE